MACDKCDYHYYPNPNEAGWQCPACGHRPGEPPGFSPELDRKLIEIKAGGLLMELTMAELIYVSNGSSGELLTARVADRCVRENRYDQYSILLYLLEITTESHAEYWQEISENILKETDIRDRCHCGKLATSWTGDKGYCSMEHQPEQLDAQRGLLQ
jgi:hypothetical protein